ncbi:uncharacterized protein [Coffea arabica]|uniref:Uncharacterized protein n=1 Tax=Coffea arabica TaxID=13443 RepID=A0ABM4WN31_COFAR
MKNLENQGSHMATAINHLESHIFGKLPSQPEANPKNVSAMTLKSGKEVEGPRLVVARDKSKEQIEKDLEKEGGGNSNPKVISNSLVNHKSNTPAFPSRLEKPRKQKKEKEILEVFRMVQVNIPLLDAVKQVPKYAKFLKDLCVNKRKLKGDEQVVVGENISAVLQRKLPPKCRDPDMFSISCGIGNTKIRDAMLNLGASINVMPKLIYDSLKLGPLKETRIIIQLADRTFAYQDRVMKML